MKKVVIYSTCQGGAIANVLNTHNDFTRNFEIVNIIHNYEYIKSQRILIEDESIYNNIINADVFIYQPLDDIYGKNSTEHLCSLLKGDCIKIRIPYVMINSLTPFIYTYAGDVDTDFNALNSGKLVVRNIESIQELINNKVSKRKILKMFDNNEIDWNYDARHKNIMSFLRNKENDVDIKVCDYIERNLSEKKLMCYYSHPSTDLLLHMTNQICDILNIDKIENTWEDNYFLNNMRFYYTTSAVRFFNLKFVDTNEMIIADRHFKEMLTNYLYKDEKRN